MCECRGAVYGFARSGRHFITSFARWFADHEQVAYGLRSFGVPCLWHDGDDAGAIKRATQAREYVVFEERAGRNVLVRSAETFSAEPWREEW